MERYARERGIAVVLPEVQRSFYTDMVYGLPYFTYVSEELPTACRRMFGLSAAREQNYIFGLSMGGYGAMKCALTYPGRYAANERFSAHLAALGIAHRFDHWPGAHTWDFWDASLRAALEYFFD